MEDGEISRGAGGSKSFGGAFSKYTPEKTSGLQVAVRKSLVIRLTKDIVETFQLCNPNFKYSEAIKLKRFLTNPSVGVLNDGYDNANSDLILHVNDVLVNPATNQRYYVKDLLGQGTFGQVAKCWVPESDSFVAVKVIKNHTAYYRQALVEVSILTMLNQKLAPDEKRHIVRILDYFIYQRHLCITFEMLGSNLFEVIKMNHYRGFPLSVVQVFSKQILHALVLIKEAGIIHCDLKPENILLSASAKPEIKVIDFGSACMEGRTVYSYIQSRYYRSPEVLLGFPYTTAIDMWSFGCIVAELFLGLPLFSGASEYDLLTRMIDILDRQPPDELLRDAKDTEKFFKHVASCYRLGDNGSCNGIASAYQILTAEEFEARTSKRPIIGKRYFSHNKLEDIIANYPYRKTLSEEELTKEKYSRLALVDFLRGLVEFDPGKRWSPLQASRHPFVTGEPFMYAYKPIPETPCIPVVHAVTVDHNPGGGHWLAAGLSPQVPSSNRGFPHNSPFHHMMPVSHGNSYGSIGSYGSYNDNTTLGSSYGSYNDVNSMYSYFSPIHPSGLNIQTQVGGPFLGASPDTRRRPHMAHGNGFGMSPKSNMGPMSLGVSPSSQMQYGPTSPVRGGGVHGSPLGKGTGQYNRRRGLGLHENASSRLQGNHNDSLGCHVGSPRGSYSASNHSNLKQQSSSIAVSHNVSDASLDKRESNSSVPDPADWDPLYSDELLLQEDNSDVSTLALEINSNLSIGNATDIFVNNNAGKSVLGQHQAPVSSSFVPPYQRTNEPIQAHSLPESSSHHFTHDARGGNSRLPPISQNSPSRFGQQSGQRYNQHSSSYNRAERTYYKGQPPRSNFAASDSHSGSHNILTSSGGMSWGRRGGHPGATTLQSSHARKDHGRMP